MHKNNFAKQSTKQIPSDGNTFEALLNKAIATPKKIKGSYPFNPCRKEQMLLCSIPQPHKAMIEWRINVYDY